MKTIFSIVIPIYNSEKTLLNCIRSIKKQKFDKFTELILIDDASTDKSKKICKFLSKQNQNIQIIYNRKNLGVSISRNKGIKKAKGDYIIFLDSDDYLIDNGLKKLANLKIISKLRYNLREQIKNSHICNDINFYKNFESSIEQIINE